MDDLDQSVVSRVSHAIKRTYCRLRCLAQHIEAYNPPDQKYRKIWDAAALLCIRNQINPFSFVEVQFATMKPWPELTHISSEAALQRYRTNAGAYSFQYATEFKVQITAYTKLMEIHGDPVKILTDESNCFDPLFIYVTACASGFGEQFKKYEEAAFAKYLTSVHYDQVYQDAVPDWFREKAKKLREGLDAD